MRVMHEDQFAGVGVSEPQRESETQRASGQLEAAVRNLEDLTENLLARIAPVMRPGTPHAIGDSPEKDPGPSSDMARGIAMMAGRVESTNEHLRSALQRLEV